MPTYSRGRGREFNSRYPDQYNLWVTEPIEIRFREYLGRVISPQDVYKAGEVIEEMIAGDNLYNYNILRNEAVFNIGNSAYIIAEEIVKIANRSKTY